MANPPVDGAVRQTAMSVSRMRSACSDGLPNLTRTTANDLTEYSREWP